MRMGIGLGVGINRSNYAQGIFNAYSARVVADGGVVESGTCVDAVSGILLNASLLLIPSGYKANKLYSEIPTNGNGDLTWARTSTAIRTNSSSLLESMATGVPRLSYMYGSCPAVLLEPQRTNLLVNSGMTGGGATPTGYTSLITGSTTAVTSIKNNSFTAYRFSGTSQRAFFVQSIGTTISTTYNFSVYCESVTTTLPVNEIISGGSIVAYYKNGVFITGTTNIEAGNLYSIILTATSTSTDIRLGAGVGANVTANIVLSMPQFEQGAYSTTFILTPTSATATRVADSFSRSNIYTNGLISASGGTWFVELRGNVAYKRDAFSDGLRVADVATGSNNGFEIRNDGGFSYLIINKRISGASTTLFSTSTSTTKIAIKWNGTSADIFVNGTKQVSATAFTTTNMEFLAGSALDVPKFIQQMALFPTPLSDAQCQTLTTL